MTSPRALWALVGATASACSLAIGDIELPAARPPVTDAAADAAPLADARVADAARPPDARPIADAAPRDAAPDMAAVDAAEPPDVTLDAAADAAPPADAAPDAAWLPPRDLARWVGRWRVHGLVEVAGELSVYDAVIDIEADRAWLSDASGRVRTPLDMAARDDGTGTLAVPLPDVGLLRAALATQSGLGVISPEPTDIAPPVAALFASRVVVPRPRLPDTMVHAVLGRTPRSGQGELGVLLRSGPYYAVRSRLTIGVANTLPDTRWMWAALGDDRFTFTEEGSGAVVAFSPDASGTGGLGLGYGARMDSPPDRVLLGLSGAASPNGPRLGPLWCGGITLPIQGPGHRAFALAAAVEPDLILAWEGAGQQALEPSQNVYTVIGGPGPFSVDGGIALHDLNDEALIVLPAQPGGRLYWGAMMCVRTDL